MQLNDELNLRKKILKRDLEIWQRLLERTLINHGYNTTIKILELSVESLKNKRNNVATCKWPRKFHVEEIDAT